MCLPVCAGVRYPVIIQRTELVSLRLCQLKTHDQTSYLSEIVIEGGPFWCDKGGRQYRVEAFGYFYDAKKKESSWRRGKWLQYEAEMPDIVKEFREGELCRSKLNQGRLAKVLALEAAARMRGEADESGVPSMPYRPDQPAYKPKRSPKAVQSTSKSSSESTGVVQEEAPQVGQGAAAEQAGGANICDSAPKKKRSKNEDFFGAKKQRTLITPSSSGGTTCRVVAHSEGEKVCLQLQLGQGVSFRVDGNGELRCGMIVSLEDPESISVYPLMTAAQAKAQMQPRGEGGGGRGIGGGDVGGEGEDGGGGGGDIVPGGGVGTGGAGGDIASAAGDGAVERVQSGEVGGGALEEREGGGGGGIGGRSLRSEVEIEKIMETPHHTLVVPVVVSVPLSALVQSVVFYDPDAYAAYLDWWDRFLNAPYCVIAGEVDPPTNFSGNEAPEHVWEKLRGEFVVRRLSHS